VSVFALPREGQQARMERAGTLVRVGEVLGEGGQAVVHLATLPNGSSFALKWYRPMSARSAQRDALRALVRTKKPHPAFLWPLDVLLSDEIDGFGYLMPLMDKRFMPVTSLLKSRSQQSFRTLAAIGQDLVDAFGELHRAGGCYRDINFNNIFADAEARQVAIVDCDNIGLDEGHIAVLGTPRFMAPEIVRGESMPCAATDLYSLAVMLFFLLMHGHPLDGRRVEATYTWQGEEHAGNTSLAHLHYGKDPLFIFDPADPSNRPLEGSAVNVWWPIYPAFIRELFTSAFTTGLRGSGLQARVAAGRWRNAMLRLRDAVSSCSNCNAAIFYDRTAPDKPCWNCGFVSPAPWVLRLENMSPTELRDGGLVLGMDAELTYHHVSSNNDHRHLAGTVDVKPGEPQTLRNLTDRPWTIHPESEQPRVVDPGRRFAIRKMDIDFGTARGRITVG
jgi:DNA-binding helix-hairpin-helix protein with protein kinase domain